MLVGVVESSARADVVLTTSPGQLTANGVVNFGGFGAEGTFVPNGSSIPVTGIPGLTLTVSGNIDGGFLRVDQGSQWSGGFTAGDKLLSTQNVFGASTIDSGLSLDFNQAIGGFGGFVQLEPSRGAALGDPSFTAFITVTDVLHEILIFGGSVTSLDGSPVFIGFRDNGPANVPAIRGIELHVDDAIGFHWDFAFDPIIQAGPGPAPGGGGAQPVPEPSSLALCAVLGVAGVVSRIKRRRQLQRSHAV